jgi:hypothetical protein
VLVTPELFVRIEIRFFYPFEFSAHCRETLSLSTRHEAGGESGQRFIRQGRCQPGKTQRIQARMRRPVHQSKLTFAEPLLKFLQDYRTLNRFSRLCWQSLTVSGPPPTE